MGTPRSGLIRRGSRYASAAHEQPNSQDEPVDGIDPPSGERISSIAEQPQPEARAGMRRDTFAVAGPITAGIAATAVVALPNMLVGGLAILIQQELGFGAAELGAAIAATFLSGAVMAVPAGRIAERFGPRRTTWAGLACGLTALLGIALLASAWITLVVFLVLAGAGITLVQLGVNVLVARAVPPNRQGLAYGTKQAAVPLASFLAGFAVPVVGLTVGWRVAFIMAAILVPIAAWRMPDTPATPRASGPAGDGRVPANALILLTAGVALASAGGNSAPAFTVLSAVDRGLSPSHAGLLLALGSLAGIVVRVVAGWLGDRLGRNALLIVVALVATGAIGFVGLALSDQPFLIALFTVLAFGGGWGWGGLVLLAVTRTSPTAPGRAMGVLQVGPMAGAVLGPLMFGWLAASASFSTAWWTMAFLALGGVATILLSRRELLRLRRARSARSA
jgi:MFS family permease